MRHSTEKFTGLSGSLRPARGFSLIELIITIVVIGILGTVGASMLIDTHSAARQVDAGNKVAVDARYALERIAREIREVNYVAGAYTVATMTASQFTFTKTKDVNNVPTNVTVSIAYASPNLALQYSLPAVTQTLSDHVQAFTFSYLDVDGCPTAVLTGGVVGSKGTDGLPNCVTPGTIRYVQLTLTLNDPASGQPIVQRTRAALRNTA